MEDISSLFNNDLGMKLAVLGMDSLFRLRKYARNGELSNAPPKIVFYAGIMLKAKSLLRAEGIAD